MAKEVIVDVKLKVANAQGQLDELNKSLSASEDLVSELEQELADLTKTQSKYTDMSDKSIIARVKLNKQIQQTKSRIDKEKKAIVDINKKRKEQNKTIKDANKVSADYSGVIGILDRQTGGLISGVTGLTGSVGKATAGFKLLRTAIIATGLGALVIAITSVATAFTASEEGQNKFRKFFTQISVVIGNVTDILSDFGSAIINVFTGNFKAAKEAINDVTDGIKNFGEETRKEIETAGKLADERAKADLMERKLIVERAEATRKFNELREKAADKENVSIEDRIAALKEAGRIEEEITLKEIEAARIRFETKKAENALSKSTKADLDEQAQLEARLIELEAKRLKRQKTLTAEITTNLREAAAERKADQAEKDAEKKEADAKALQAEKDLANLKKQIRDAEANTEDEKRALELIKIDEHYTALIEKAKLNDIATTELEDAQRQAKINKQKQFDEIDEKREKEHQDNIKKIKEVEIQTEQQIQQARLSLASQFGNLLTQIGGKNKTAAIAGVLIQKAASIGQIISNTGIANAKAVAASPLTAGQPFVTINSISAGLSIASSLAQAQKAIQQIKSAGGGTASGVGSTGGGGVSVPIPQAPSFNVVGTSPENQLAQTLADATQKPVKAFVVASDVTTAQSLDRNIIQESSLG
jgi:DNA repair exonuclease SbcCD ATPase subunit